MSKDVQELRAQEKAMHTYSVNYIGDCAESKWPCDLAGSPHDHAYVAVLVKDEDAAVAAMLAAHPGATVTSVVDVARG